MILTERNYFLTVKHPELGGLEEMTSQILRGFLRGWKKKVSHISTLLRAVNIAPSYHSLVFYPATKQILSL